MKNGLDCVHTLQPDDKTNWVWVRKDKYRAAFIYVVEIFPKFIPETITQRWTSDSDSDSDN